MEKILDLNSIKDANDKSIKKISVPEWGGVVFIRSISLGDMLTLNESYIREDGTLDKDNKNFILDLVSCCLCDPYGKKIFGDKEGKTILMDKSSGVLLTLFKECQEHNFATEEGAAKLEKK